MLPRVVPSLSLLMLLPLCRVAAQAVPAQPTTTVLVAPRIAPVAVAVAEARPDGYVALEDGTFWEAELPDRPTAVTWRPEDVVEVRRIPAPRGDYEFWLINATRDERIAARFAGRPRATGLVEPGAEPGGAEPE